jgi:hypothetical protein
VTAPATTYGLGLFDPLDPDLRPIEQAGLGDVSIANLQIDAVSKKARGLNARLENSIEDCTIVLSMSEVPKLSLTVVDSHSDLLTSGIFEYKIDTSLDDVPFRLVEVDGQDDDTLVLSCEHRLVAYAREHTTPRKFSRAKFTRAEAARACFREIKAIPVRFVSPDIHKVQPLAKPDTSAPSQADGGFADGVAIARGDGHVFTPAQIRNAEVALTQAAKDNSPPKATLSLAEACIVEAPNFDNPMGGDGTSSGILQLLSSHLKGSTSTKGGRRDIALVCHLFLTEGFTGRGGAIALARAHPEWTAGQVAQAVQGSAFPKRYDQAKATAQRVIDHFQGGGVSFGAGGTYWKSYEFTRGQAHKPEDTWVCTGRWADEVRWRRFVVGSRSVFFVADDQLMRSRPRYLIDPTTTGVIGRPTFNLEVGGRTVVVKGRRELKPSECELRVRIDRWKAPPGSNIEIADFGPLDGRWLVETISRSAFDAEGTISLRQPQKALPEPRSESRQRAATSASATLGVGNTAKALKDVTLGHPWAGTQSLFSQVIDPFMADRGLAPGSRKRSTQTTATGGTSDHWTGSTEAYATDYPTNSGDDDAKALSKALHVPYKINTYNSGYIVVHGRRFRVQILWGAAIDHGDHVHVGIRYVGLAGGARGHQENT